MITSPMTLEQTAVATARAQEHWSKRHQTQAATNAGSQARKWTIAITREAGTDGTAIAREVASKLGWAVYDRELVEKIARDMGLHASLMDTLDERRRSWLVEFAEGFATGDLSESRFVRHLVETLLSLGEHGHCVIVGRGAAQVLPAEKTLRVRLVGKLEDRIKDAQHKLGLTREAAERWVKDTDKERTQFVKSHFSKDPRDVEQCDLILNTSRWSIAECAELIVQAVRLAEKKA
jgi:cytidylate kinase